MELVKSFCDSFMETDVDEVLRDNNVSKLVIGGMQTDFCVDTTCRQAAALGYDVLLVADAHSTLDHEYLKAAQIVAHHNRILRHLDSSKGRVRVVETGKVSFILISHYLTKACRRIEQSGAADVSVSQENEAPTR